jgi:hypothetical protein
MPLFPKIQSPCPFQDNLSEVMEGDFCTHCQHKVIDLTDMNDAERTTLLQEATGKLCVSYRLPVRRMAAALAAATMLPSALAAQTAEDAEPTPVSEEGEVDDQIIAGGMDVIIVGGIRADPELVEMDTADDAKLAELPVVYEEDDATAQKDSAKPAE